MPPVESDLGIGLDSVFIPNFLQKVTDSKEQKQFGPTDSNAAKMDRRLGTTVCSVREALALWHTEFKFAMVGNDWELLLLRVLSQ